ncbi:ABC transporter permease [Psychroflexus planctonicus]|uniref:Membrane protein n=1 Tax=Psychroflexus planctonicus TaxID=1526575 RepID=A0ABQ1SDE8_9FLAO|nr:ABC transporter permease [Psychroflexus planctonicus]GGE24540.1 membrane protein [Psychroflexus planctonicus]
MKFSSYIAKRYLFSKSERNAINWITGIAALGVIAGAFSLFVVMSTFAGLKEFSLQFSNEFDPDLKVTPKLGKTLQFSNKEEEKLKAITGVSLYSKFVEERSLVKFKNNTTAAFIKGVDANFLDVSQMQRAVDLGDWFTKEYQVVLGNQIARTLGTGINDPTGVITFMVPKPGKGQVSSLDGAFRTTNAMATGFYRISEELDGKYMFADIDFTKDYLGLEEDEFSGIEIKLAPDANLSEVKEQVAAVFDEAVFVKDRVQLNDQLYKMLNTEYLAVYFIFTLVIIVALFNVIGSLIMAILDKRKDIKTLSNLGATNAQLKNIFFKQGVYMTLIGGGIGLVLALLLVVCQMQFGWFLITPSLPYPVKIEISNLLIVGATISVLGILASWVAAQRVEKVLM